MSSPKRHSSAGPSATRLTAVIGGAALAISAIVLVSAQANGLAWAAAVVLWLAIAAIWWIARTAAVTPPASPRQTAPTSQPPAKPATGAAHVKPGQAGNEHPTEILDSDDIGRAVDAAANGKTRTSDVAYETRSVKLGDTAKGDIPSPAATRKIRMGDTASGDFLSPAFDLDVPPDEQLTGGIEPAWRELVRRMPFDLYTIDQDAVIHYVHQLPDHGYGLRVGSLLTDLIRLDHAKELRDAISTCLEQGRRQRLEAPAAVPGHDDSERWLSIELAPLGAANPAATITPGDSAVTGRHLLVVAQDITEHRHLADRQQTGQRLEALGRLTSGVGHDFNNILTIIHCNALLLQDALPEDAPELDEILTAVDRATRLTHQILAFSRSTEIKTRVLNLNESVDKLMKMLRRLIGENIELDLIGEPNLWRVRADITQVDQVVMNLVVNARDAMPRGGRIVIRSKNVIFDQDKHHAHGVIPAGDYVALEITDTGEGITAENVARIFEPYFSTKAAGQSYGLGLATVRTICTNAGGDITCRSTVHVGTTFTVYFPVFTGESSQVSSIEEPPLPLPTTATILLVEDEEAVRDVASRILERNGYEVLVAARGSEARKICREYPHSIDLLFTDVVMPDINGAELSDAIVSMRPDIAVLFTSGYTESVRVEQGNREVPIHFLPKPYTAAALTGKVAEIITARQNAATPKAE